MWIILVFIVIVIVLSYYLLGNGYNMLEVWVKLKLDEIVIIGYLVVFLMILIIVFGVVMCFCYIRIIKYVWFSDEVKNVKNKVFLRFWWKLIKIFIVVIIVFVVSWLLFFGKFFVKSFWCSECFVFYEVIYILLVLLGFMVNFIMYLFCCLGFR